MRQKYSMYSRIVDVKMYKIDSEEKNCLAPHREPAFLEADQDSLYPFEKAQGITPLEISVRHVDGKQKGISHLEDYFPGKLFLEKKIYKIYLNVIMASQF